MIILGVVFFIEVAATIVTTAIIMSDKKGLVFL